MPSKFTNFFFIVASTVLIISASLYITEDQLISKIISYSYAISGTIVAAFFLITLYKGENFRLKRLNFQQVIAALLLPVSSYFFFNRQNEWFMLLLISVFLQVYIVVVKSIEEKKGKI